MHPNKIHPDPRSFLPLTPRAFQILLALAGGDRHGYSLMNEVNEQSAGLTTLRTGALYTLLQRLTEARLIEESDTRPRADEDDDRRRYWRLTALGNDVLAAEARRLESLLGDARRKHVLGRAKKA